MFSDLGKSNNFSGWFTRNEAYWENFVSKRADLIISYEQDFYCIIEDRSKLKNALVLFFNFENAFVCLYI